MLRREMKDNAMRWVSQESLPGRYGLEDSALSFDPEITFKTDRFGDQMDDRFGGMCVQMIHDPMRLGDVRARCQVRAEEVREVCFCSRWSESGTHLPSDDVEPGNEGLGAVTDVLKLATFDAPRGHRPRWSNSLKRLNSGHFVK